MDEYKIYGILDRQTKQIGYVGYTSQPLQTRLTQHISHAFSNYSNVSQSEKNWIVNEVQDPDDLEIVELDRARTKEQAEKLEQEWIALLRPKGYAWCNRSAGGAGQVGLSPSTETRQKISKSMKVNRYGKKID